MSNNSSLNGFRFIINQYNTEMKKAIASNKLYDDIFGQIIEHIDNQINVKELSPNQNIHIDFQCMSVVEGKSDNNFKLSLARQNRAIYFHTTYTYQHVVNDTSDYYKDILKQINSGILMTNDSNSFTVFMADYKNNEPINQIAKTLEFMIESVLKSRKVKYKNNSNNNYIDFELLNENE